MASVKLDLLFNPLSPAFSFIGREFSDISVPLYTTLGNEVSPDWSQSFHCSVLHDSVVGSTLLNCISLTAFVPLKFQLFFLRKRNWSSMSANNKSKNEKLIKKRKRKVLILLKIKRQFESLSSHLKGEHWYPNIIRQGNKGSISLPYSQVSYHLLHF